MAAEVDQHSFKKLALKRFPKLDKRESGEGTFWKKYQFPITVKETAAITAVQFSPSSPHDFAVTSGPRIQVYSAATNQVKKSVSRFQQVAYSGCFRNDGKLLAAGSEEGVVRVFDVGSRAVLRQFKGHTKGAKTNHPVFQIGADDSHTIQLLEPGDIVTRPCKAVCYSVDGLKVFSGSDDTTVKYWDLATQDCLATLQGHEDYIRTVFPSPNSSDLLVTASYDHSLRLWDVRRPERAVLELSHGAPVEDVVMFPSGGTCVSCGSHWIRVWDLLGGGRMLLTFSNHQKTITSLCFDGGHERLLSGGLDKQVKVYSVEDYRVVHSMSYPAPILSMAMSPTDSHLVVGTTSKLLNIKTRPPKHVPTPVSSAAMPKGGSYRYFVRGKTYKPTQEEYVVAVPKMTKLNPYEKLLKKFKYKKALYSCLMHRGTGSTLIAYSVMQELARRDALHIALSGLTEDELYPLLSFLSHNLINPAFTPLLLDICNIVADIYGGVLSQSKTTMALFKVLRVKVDGELQFQKHAFQLLGSIDTLLTASTIHETTTHK